MQKKKKKKIECQFFLDLKNNILDQFFPLLVQKPLRKIFLKKNHLNLSQF